MRIINRSNTGTLAFYLMPLLLVLCLTPLGLMPQALATLPEDPAPEASPEVVAAPLEPLPIHANTTRNIVDALASRHYVSLVLDDKLSGRILDGYVGDLDPSKSYFLASDIAGFEKYRDTLDNSLRAGDLDPAFDIFNRYHQRVTERFEQLVAMLEGGIDHFDFTIDESLELDRKDAAWAQSSAELDDLWRKRIKNSVLNLKLTDKDSAKITELMLKRYKNRLVRAQQTNAEDVYQLYMNAFTKTYDPHTVYFSPRTSENFNINMSLSLEGIGAVLQREDEYTKVVSLVPEGPADKSKQLFPNDKIVGVGQGTDGEITDVIGWRLDEVVQLIRGKKDTIVKLDIVPIAGGTESRTIEITRNTVKLEEQSAKSEIIEVEQFGAVHKIGIIDIPTFYIDFQGFQRGDKDYKSTTRDVQKLLVDLVEQGVEGIVVDLRDNGGGALQEARSLTGLFIDYGPTVQIRSKSNRVDILRDRDIKTVYDGPLGVLVNRLSASASEIFAGAIQDYQRGVIIGSQTFGKGTVQSLLPLNRGQLKMTQAKFYRITGESTQHKGIIPDITYPSNYNPEMIGESTLDDPLPWDKIQPTRYRERLELSQMIPQLRTLHSERIDGDAEFSYLIDATEYRHEQSNDTTITLNEQQRLREKDEAEAFWLTLENKKRTSQGLAEIASLDELNPPVLDVADNTQATGIVPITDQAEDSSSGPDGSITPPEQRDAIKGNEIAVIGDVGGGMAVNNTGSVIVATSDKTKTDADSEVAIDAGDADDQTTEDEDRPDTYLMEAGNILLDLISISSRTAEDDRTRKI